MTGAGELRLPAQVRPAVARVTGLDHVVLNVADARRSLAWYGGLGLAPERLEEWERGEAPFVSLRVDATTVIDLLETTRTGTNVDHLCLVLAPGTDLGALAASGRFGVVSGPARVWGAQGWGEGLYVRDPDGNVVELRVYPGA